MASPKEQQQEIALLKQRVNVLKQEIRALENRLSGLLKDLEARKQFFNGKKL